MTGSPFARAAALSFLIALIPCHASAPQELRQRLIDSCIGSGLSPQKL
jgi:BarA-like signal transduction histidine kinase